MNSIAKSFEHVDSRRDARRAGVLLMAMGAAALLFGGALLLVSNISDATLADPQLQARLHEMQMDVATLRPLFRAAGFLFLAYAVAAMALGFFVRGRHRAWVITAMVFCIAVGALSLVGVIATAARGAFADTVVPLISAAGHGVALVLLFNVLRRQTAASSAGPAWAGNTTAMASYYHTPPFAETGEVSRSSASA